MLSKTNVFVNLMTFFHISISGTSEIDQLYKIASILGTPGRNDWVEGFSLANQMSFRFPTFSPTHLSNVLGSRSSARAVSFLYALLSWNPSWRSSAQEALRHSYFRMPNGTSQHPPTSTQPLSNNNVFHEDNKCEVIDVGEHSMRSLSLRPRNNDSTGPQQPQPQPSTQGQPHGVRLPLPLTEIEPHYSR